MLHQIAWALIWCLNPVAFVGAMSCVLVAGAKRA